MKAERSARARTGITAGIVGIALNFILSAAKITVGLVSGLISVLADGFNNLSDCGTGVITLISFRMSYKPADREHPFGHRRAEHVAALSVGFLILLFAAELISASVQKIVRGGPTQGGVAVYAVLGASVLVKAALFAYFTKCGKKINSQTLRASGTDCAADCLATLAVIAGALISRFTSFPADGWAGIVVALFVIWQGVSVIREAASNLMGKAAPKQLADGIRAYLKAGEGVLGVHDLSIYQYGEDRIYASAHVEMSADVPSMEAHSVLDGLETGVFADFGVHLTVHLDPVDLTDAEAVKLKGEVANILGGKGLGLTIHDFRLVRGKAVKVIFDVCAPYDCKLSEAEILSLAQSAVLSLGGYVPVITVDRE